MLWPAPLLIMMTRPNATLGRLPTYSSYQHVFVVSARRAWLRTSNFRQIGASQQPLSGPLCSLEAGLPGVLGPAGPHSMGSWLEVSATALQRPPPSTQAVYRILSDDFNEPCLSRHLSSQTQSPDRLLTTLLTALPTTMTKRIWVVYQPRRPRS